MFKIKIINFLNDCTKNKNAICYIMPWFMAIIINILLFYFISSFNIDFSNSTKFLLLILYLCYFLTNEKILVSILKDYIKDDSSCLFLRFTILISFVNTFIITFI